MEKSIINGGSRSGVTSDDENGIEGNGGIEGGSRTLLGGDQLA